MFDERVHVSLKYKYIFPICFVHCYLVVSYRNFELFFAVAGSGSKDGKNNKDTNSPSGPYAGKLNNHFFHIYLNNIL